MNAFDFLIIAVILGLIAEIFKIEKLFPESFKAKPWIIAILLVIAAIFTSLYEYLKEPETKTTINYQPTFNSVSGGKDSSNRKTIIIRKPKAADNPNMNFTFDNGISIDSFTDDIISVRVRLTSYFAPSILKEATIYSLASESQNENIIKDLIFFGKVPFLNKNLGFDKNFQWDGGIVNSGLNLKKIKTIIILVKGVYTDSNKENPQTLDKVGVYDITSKRFGLLLQPYDDSVRIFLKRKGIIKKL